MKFAKTAFASLVASSLVMAPVAAEARTASSVAQKEELAGGSAILYIAVIAFAAGMIVLLSNDSNNTDNLPASP